MMIGSLSLFDNSVYTNTPVGICFTRTNGLYDVCTETSTVIRRKRYIKKGE
jgi:hypothetical protein